MYIKKIRNVFVLTISVGLLGLLASSIFSEESELPKYIGSDDCEMCHDTMKADIAKGVHSFIFDSKDTPEIYGCEACHGPGEKHVQGQGEDNADLKKMMINPAKAAADVSSAQCMKCHKDFFDEQDWLNGRHIKNNIGCPKCHKIHAYDPKKDPIKEGYKFCLKECHETQEKEFGNSKAKFGHKIPKVANCLSCHSPHSRINLNTSREACVKCHADKKGPFKFPHGNGRIQECTVCHYPHVMDEPRMLKRKASLDLMYEEPNMDDKKKKDQEKKDKEKHKDGKLSERDVITFCLQCHTQHKTDNCLGCHQPPLHVEPPKQGMCQRCHAGHGFAGCPTCHGNPHPNGVIPRDCSKCHQPHNTKSCLDCHPFMHGSNDSRRFFEPTVSIKIPGDDLTPKPQLVSKRKQPTGGTGGAGSGSDSNKPEGPGTSSGK